MPRVSLSKVIFEIYSEKVNFDVECDMTNAPRYSIVRFVHQYFFIKYGLRKLEQQHTRSLVAATKNYQPRFRIQTFPMFCGMNPKYDDDELGFYLMLFSKIQRQHQCRLDFLDDGSCWVSENHSIVLIMFSINFLIIHGPYLVNKLFLDRTELVEIFLNKLDKISVPGAYVIRAVFQACQRHYSHLKVAPSSF